jgi:hypothetical protein
MSNALATTDKKKLTPKQIQVLTLLIAGHTNEGAANNAEVAISTIHSWLKNPQFNEEYRVGMERYRMVLEGRLNSIAQIASNKIKEFLENPNPEIRLEAAKIAINAAVRSNNRYKELQVQGFIAPVQPLVIFPAGTQLPWAAKDSLPMLPVVPEDIIEAESVEISEPEEDSDNE